MDLIEELLELAGCQTLTEMAYPTNFSLEEFSQIRSFKGRVDYCEQRLQRLGSGSSRIAYKVDDEKCLKIAKNQKGIAQNIHEARSILDQYGIGATVYEYDENGLWVEMQLARKCTKPEFKRIMGISFDDMTSFAWASFARRNPHNKIILPVFIKNRSIEKWVYDNEGSDSRADWLLNFESFVGDFNPSMGVLRDVTSIRNWGIVKENGKEKAVIIDDGLDEAIAKEFY